MKTDPVKFICESLFFFFAIGFAMFLLLSVTDGQTLVQQPQTYSFSSRVGGTWLTVSRINRKDDPDTWHPSMTYLVSDYVPLVKKLQSGKYQITWSSELCKELP
jgi:hypothetical protein